MESNQTETITQAELFPESNYSQLTPSRSINDISVQQKEIMQQLTDRNYLKGKIEEALKILKAIGYFKSLRLLRGLFSDSLIKCNPIPHNNYRTWIPFCKFRRCL